MVCKLIAAVTIIFIARTATSQTRDTVYRDSIVRRPITVRSEPVSVAVEGGFYKHFVSEGTLPSQLASGCDTFSVAGSDGFSFMGSLAIPIGTDIYLSPSLSFRDLTSEHTYGEFFTDTVRTGNDSLIRTSVPFEHTITAPTKAIGLGLSIGARFSGHGFCEVGFEGMFVTNKSYEKHLRPTGTGGFTDGSRDSLESSGDLPDAASFLPALRASVGAEFPMSSRLFFSPVLTAVIPFSGVTPYWSITSLGGSLRLRYLLSPDEHVEEVADTIRVPVIVERQSAKPKLQAEIRAVGITRSGVEEDVVRLDVEEVKARVAFPMLNYIFFSERSAEIPQRYQQFPTPEDARSYFKGTTDRRSEKLLEMYWETLNIIGSRMAAHPASRITLIGSTSNTGVEKNALSLARDRAETVKKYLVNIWNIAPDRIRTQARLLPEKPSPSTIAQGEEENRRVEIVSTDERITDPIVVSNIEHLATPSEISLRAKMNAEAGVRHSVATISIAGKELVRYEGAGKMLARQRAWTVTEDALNTPSDSLDLKLEVTDSAGNTISARGSIPLVRNRTQRERPEAIERYSLILFSFDEDVLGSKNERTVRSVGETFKRLEPKRVTIVGYTDELGDQQHNDELSLRRAESASRSLARSLRDMRIELPSETLIEGRGSRELLYDNRLPEGRFFSRTVNITIEKRE